MAFQRTRTTLIDALLTPAAVATATVLAAIPHHQRILNTTHPHSENSKPRRSTAKSRRLRPTRTDKVPPSPLSSFVSMVWPWNESWQMRVVVVVAVRVAMEVSQPLSCANGTAFCAVRESWRRLSMPRLVCFVARTSKLGTVIFDHTRSCRPIWIRSVVRSRLWSNDCCSKSRYATDNSCALLVCFANRDCAFFHFQSRVAITERMQGFCVDTQRSPDVRMI